MKPIRWTILAIMCLVFGMHLWGCRSAAPPKPSPLAAAPLPTSWPASHQLEIFFVRHATYAGAGRTHILKIDDRAVGPLTSDNYYQFTMWQGEYQFSVDLPREEFFGQVSDPETISRQIDLTPHPDGHRYLLEYTDGLGSAGLSIKRMADVSAILDGRMLAGRLDARDTAQATQFHEARYDGPASGGKPHGQGKLSWPDGSVYRGTFEHGVPTRKARFFFPDGTVYMGPNYRGRPSGTGLLMTERGRILFAGRLENEKPDGRGIRDGARGPEFCIYEDGRDITKTFRQLASESLDLSDRETIRTRRDPEKEIAAKIQFQQQRLADMAVRHDPDTVTEAMANARKEIEQLEKSRQRHRKSHAAAQEAFVAQLQATRYEREIAKAKEFRKRHQARMEKERQWCRDERELGRDLCICAPLTEDFQDWEACWEPVRKRYIE